MTSIRKLYKKEYAASLLRIADGDFKTILALNKDMDFRKENILFICQQVIEKSLKAVLCHLQIPLLLSHDLEAILTLIPETHMPPHSSEVSYFTPYATIRRYEEGFEELTNNEILNAMNVTRDILSWAKTVTSK